MIENLRNKFVENPESLKDYYNDLDKLIESKKDLNVFITYDKSFVDQQVEKLIEKAKNLSLIHISEPTRPRFGSRMPSSA